MTMRKTVNSDIRRLTMKENRHYTFCRFMLGAGFIYLAAVLIIPLFNYTTVQAAESVVCTPTSEPDSDGDGFSDAEELAGITINGVLYDDLDPYYPDAFIEVDKANVSLLPDDALAFLRESGLEVTFHELPEGTLNAIGTERIVLQRSDGTCQKAVKIYEHRTYYGDCYVILGETKGQGPPNNDLGPVHVYTDRIKCFVETKNLCGSVNECVDNFGETTANAINRNLNLNTVAHEGGHRYKLNTVFNPRYGGWHDKEGAGVLMEQSSKVTSRKNKVTFYISDKFSDPADIDGTVLK
jgi:hypothetical protein